MDITSLTAVVTLLLTLSIASERLVEIIKGLVPFLNKEITDDAKREGWRKATLQCLAVVSGILTAYLAKPVIPDFASLKLNGTGAYFALGLLASGGSGFWNSILTYVTKLKDIKGAQAEKAKVEANEAKKAPVASSGTTCATTPLAPA